ncbi:DNA-binding transcriptional regulator, Lrp family [Thermoactinomyces sp. DSM 45891]|uniref:Lrp/AsnC family transcriptional regulator n=1 Tax=Thermoactinomyces sp. DSM 45891 TaxID=1761907 RepID=UPI00091D3619|nr:Lrp/AsnC family transcriptional regulator [Thermoactinomyces sp. DSM 45891]SFX19421.1 DNA-binding transcriptional regulator, Lrp family [Thermoactinomyces sp. DSM 45891]
MTDLHLEILSLFEENARLTTEQIAHLVNEPLEKVQAIIRQFEDEQIILKHRTIIDWTKAGRPRVTALIDVKVTPQHGYGFDALAQRIYHYPEVKDVYLMSGAYDLSVSLEVPTMEAVGQFVTEKLAPLEFVVSTTTHFVLKKFKEDGITLYKPNQDRRISIIP